MGLNISLRFVKKKNLKKGTPFSLYLRIRTNDGSSETTINTGQEIDSRYWKNGSVSNKHPNYTNIIRVVTKIREDLEQIIVDETIDNKVPNPRLVKKKYEELQRERENQTHQPLSWEECWKRFLRKKEIETTFYTHRMYKQLKERLDSFSRETKVTLSFNYVCSEDFELDFRKWSLEVRKHKNSYIRKNYTSLKSFLNYCVENGFIDVRLRNYKKPKVLDKKEVVYLLREEVIKLSETIKYDYKEGRTYRKEIVLIEDFNRRGKVRYFTNWELSKDLLLMMCVLGCRWNDIHYLTWDSQNFDSETFTWENQKTKKYTTVPIDPIGIEILKKYGRSKSREMKIFPTYSQQKFNDTIKKVFKDLGFNRLVSVSEMMGTKTVNTEKKPLHQVVSSHTGRRTFIMNLLNKGLDYKTIMSMTGHSDVKSLMKYLSVENERVELGRNVYSDNGDTKSQFQHLFNKLTEKDKEKVIDYMRLFVR